MDMRRHLRRWLNDAALQRLGDSYSGVVADVVEEHVRNPYTAKRELQPVVMFDDGYRLIPNFGMRTALIELFGPHTENWTGRRITVIRQRRQTLNRATGEVRERFVKTVYCADKHARVIPHPAAALGSDDAIERADYDDRTNEEVARDELAARKRHAR